MFEQDKKDMLVFKQLAFKNKRAIAILFFTFFTSSILYSLFTPTTYSARSEFSILQETSKQDTIRVDYSYIRSQLIQKVHHSSFVSFLINKHGLTPTAELLDSSHSSHPYVSRHLLKSYGIDIQSTITGFMSVQIISPNKALSENMCMDISNHLGKGYDIEYKGIKQSSFLSRMMISASKAIVTALILCCSWLLFNHKLVP